MKVLVIYAHPWEGSFNHAILEAAVSGLKTEKNQVDVLDLNKDGFNPVLTREELAIYRKGAFLDPKVGEYQARITAADYLFFIFPIWWGGMPAILKGFVDKVFLNDWAYGKIGFIPKGMLTQIKGATVVATMGASKFFYGLILSSAAEHLFSKGILNFCGVEKVKWFAFYDAENQTDEKRRKWLAEIKTHATELRYFFY